MEKLGIPSFLIIPSPFFLIVKIIQSKNSLLLNCPFPKLGGIINDVMNILRNILAVVAGWFVGSLVNMGLVQLGHSIFPIEGVDPTDMEAFAAVIPTLGPEYFIFPFLAHAVGTFAGAGLAAAIGVNQKMTLALIVGVLFLLGGIVVNYMLPGPIWFSALDIVVAYIPMAYFAAKLVQKQKNQS